MGTQIAPDDGDTCPSSLALPFYFPHDNDAMMMLCFVLDSRVIFLLRWTENEKALYTL